MKSDRSLRGVVVAIAGAFVTFCLVAVTIDTKMAGGGANGFLHGSPGMLSAAMAGLFGGGVAALVMLILLLQWR
jgi:hypothetical protein